MELPFRDTHQNNWIQQDIIRETTIMDFITSLILNFRTELTEEIHYSHDYWIFLLPLVLIASDVVSGWISNVM